MRNITSNSSFKIHILIDAYVTAYGAGGTLGGLGGPGGYGTGPGGYGTGLGGLGGLGGPGIGEISWGLMSYSFF